MKKRYVVIPVCILGLCAGWLAFCGYAWSWGPFGKLHDLKTAKLPGNASQYGPESIRPLDHSPLTGKTYCVPGIFRYLWGCFEGRFFC